MKGRKQCPECDSYQTNRVHTEWYSDMIEEVRVCESCPTQFINRFSHFEKEPQEVPA